MGGMNQGTWTRVKWRRQHPSIVYLSICLASYLSVSLSHGTTEYENMDKNKVENTVCIHLLTYLPIHLSIYLFIYLSVFPFIYLSIHLSVSVYPIIYQNERQERCLAVPVYMNGFIYIFTSCYVHEMRNNCLWMK